MEVLNPKSEVVIPVERIERQVVFYVNRGAPLTEIASRIGLSLKSVKKLLENVARKIEAANSTDSKNV